MATLPLDHLRSVFNSSVINDLALSLNENQTSTRKAVDALLPTVAAGVVNKASDREGSTLLYQLLKNTTFATDPTIGELVTSSSERQRAAESGNEQLKKLYDQRVHQIAQETSRYSGVSLGSATTLTGLVASVLMGFLHKQVVTQDLTEVQLAAILDGGADATRATTPVVFGLPLAWFIGKAYITPTPAVPVQQGAVQSLGLRWQQWLPIVLVLILVLLLLLLLRACGPDKTAPKQTNSAGGSHTNRHAGQ